MNARRITLYLALATMAFPLHACVKNRATGKSQLNMLTRAEEIQIGEQAMGQMTEEYGGEVPDAVLRQYVSTAR